MHRACELIQALHAFICSADEDLLGAHCVPGAVLVAGGTEASLPRPLHEEATFNGLRVEIRLCEGPRRYGSRLTSRTQAGVGGGGVEVIGEGRSE